MEDSLACFSSSSMELGKSQWRPSRANSAFDRTSMSAMLILFALPSFVFAGVIQSLQVILYQNGLPYLPPSGWGKLENWVLPVLVLSATASAEGFQEPQELTLIARTNLEGDLRRLFFSETDSHHLDVTPRMELIDAVDADGDGRGELLFRRTFDSGSVYAIYRVTADQLWPLYEPEP